MRPQRTICFTAVLISVGFFLPGALARAQSTAAQGNLAALLSLDQAIARAEANEPVFAAARAEQQALKLERTNARAAFLPSTTYHNQAIYTQPNGIPASRIGQTTNAPSPIFIANNAVREYASQGVFNETVGFAQVGALRLATANAARAEAELEVTRRGLVAAVVALYYSLAAGQQRIVIAERALAESSRFVDITQKREAAREAAHADVLKAQISQQGRQRELDETKLANEKNRLELGVLLYPDPATPYSVLPLADAPPLLPDLPRTESLARDNNPELRSALASVQASQAETYASRAALLPDLALNFTYGIDATNFGVNGPDGIRNLGYSMSAALDIPVWDWLTTERRIKASRLREGAVRVALSSTQRRLTANLAEFYAEARTAKEQLTRLDATVITARESLRLTNLRYVDGESTVLEVVDAQNTLLSAETARIDGRIRYQLALVNLQTLTGRL